MIVHMYKTQILHTCFIRFEGVNFYGNLIQKQNIPGPDSWLAPKGDISVG